MQNSVWGELGAKIDEREKQKSNAENEVTKAPSQNNSSKKKSDDTSVDWDKLDAQLDQLEEGVSTDNAYESGKKEITKENIPDSTISQVDSQIVFPKIETQFKNNITDEKLADVQDVSRNFNVNTSKMGFQIHAA